MTGRTRRTTHEAAAMLGMVALLLLGLLCTSCTPTVQLEHRITDLERQLMRPSTPAAARRPPVPTWQQRFDAIPRGASYAEVVQRVGQPTHLEREGPLALGVYYVSEAEIYVLVFEAGLYTQGYRDTYANWMKVLTSSGARS